MDTDPPGTLDFIWYRGRGVKVLDVQKMGDKHDLKDPTIYGSDHYPLVAEFEISLETVDDDS